MDRNALGIDRSRHLVYSQDAEKIIQSRLAKRYESAKASELYEKIQEIYVSSMKDIVYMGGGKNGQAQSVYDCAAFFAYYEALPQKPTLQELESMNDELFIPPMKRVGFASLNCPLILRAAHGIFSALAKRGRKKAQEWPGNYIMETEPLGPDRFIRYKFHRCPIAEFAKKRGLCEIMPSMCNSDYAMLKALHGGLIRTTTCGFGDYCDYLITGDKNPVLKDHPLIRDKNGYLVNISSPY